MAGITTAAAANVFLRERCIATFNQQFQVAAAQKGTAFRRATRADLDWIFTVQTERVVAKDNTVAIGDRMWQIEKSRFRSSLAGCTVTIHEHLDGAVSIRYGPHVLGRWMPAPPEQGTRRGKGGTGERQETQPLVSSPSPRPLEIPASRDFHFPPVPTKAALLRQTKTTRKPASAGRRGTQGQMS